MPTYTLGGGRKAIEEEQFVLHYQPKIRLLMNSVVLVRRLNTMVSPRALHDQPDQFYSFGEESGF